MNWKYEVIIYWSDDDKAFVAEVPELPGCLAHGGTQCAALANANHAVELWLVTAVDNGRATPAPRGRRPMFA